MPTVDLASDSQPQKTHAIFGILLGESHSSAHPYCHRRRLVLETLFEENTYSFCSQIWLRMGFLEALFGGVLEPVSNIAKSGSGFASSFGFVFQPPSQPGYTVKQGPSGKLLLGPGKP